MQGASQLDHDGVVQVVASSGYANNRDKDLGDARET